jgi:hypothetical protein
MSFLSFLSNKGVITPESEPAVEQYAQNEDISIDEALVKNGVPEETVLNLRSEYHNIPTRSVGWEKIPAEVLKYVPEESASHYHFAPIGVKDGVLEVGVIDPENTESMDAIQFISTKVGMPFKVYLISLTDFQNVLQSYRGISGEVDRALKELGSESKPVEDEYAAAVAPAKTKEQTGEFGK